MNFFLLFQFLFPSPVPHPSCSVSLQLLCQNPLHRLRYLHHFQVHPFFRGVAFDPELLQKQPVNFVMETQATQPSPSESMLFKDFDCNLESYLVHPSLAWAPLLYFGAHLGNWGSSPLLTEYDHLNDSVYFYFVASYHSVLLDVVPEFKSWAFCYWQPKLALAPLPSHNSPLNSTSQIRVLTFASFIQCSYPEAFSQRLIPLFPCFSAMFSLLSNNNTSWVPNVLFMCLIDLSEAVWMFFKGLKSWHFNP